MNASFSRDSIFSQCSFSIASVIWSNHGEKIGRGSAPAGWPAIIAAPLHARDMIFGRRLLESFIKP
jgi:hypothetical protein